MAKQWFAYNNMAKIALIERGKQAESNYRGKFFDSWDDAHTLVLQQAEVRLKTAELHLTRSREHMRNAQKMKRPNLVSAA